MSSSDNNSNDLAVGNEEEELVDITDLIRLCATEGLSYSHPFTPLASQDLATTLMAKRTGNVVSDGGDGKEGTVTDDTLLEGLSIKGTSLTKVAEGGEDTTTPTNAAPDISSLDLQDAMTALELGDKRMDCCEIPLDAQSINNASPKEGVGEVTFPPRIAPTSLSDGTPSFTKVSQSDTSCALIKGQPLPANTLLLPETPTPSLLPHWESLKLSSSSILPLLLLQLTALEAYIGTNNGGSNAAETLYCMIWCHDGILVDMANRLGVGVSSMDGAEDCLAEAVNISIQKLEKIDENGTDAQQQQGNKTTEEEELNVAQWALFASSLGIVRIAETVRWVVVNADFYEEEDFGVTLHGSKEELEKKEQELEETRRKLEEMERELEQMKMERELLEDEKEGGTDSAAGSGDAEKDTDSSKAVAGDNTKGNGNATCSEEHPKKREGTSMRFCPTLQGSNYIEVIWDTALSKLRNYGYLCDANENDGKNQKNKNEESKTAIIIALESILTAQQSLFQAIKILSNLNDETVRDFTTIASRRSNETANLLENVRDMNAVKQWVNNGLVTRDGKLLHTMETTDQTTKDLADKTSSLLSASFDPFLNRRLLGNAPVRKANFRPPSDVLTSLSQLAAELDWGVCNPILYGNSFGRITRMLENNSLRGCGGVVPMAATVPKKKEEKKDVVSKNGAGKKQSGGLEMEQSMGMNILSRSLLVLNLYFDDKLFGQYEFSEMLAQHMKQQCAVPDLLLTSTDWLNRMAKPMYDTLKALCLNRHRERSFTESVLLPSFQVLQYEAANVDEKFRTEHGLDTKNVFATNYVIVNTIRLMERHVGLGIELGLYPNWYDLSTALWYRDFLLSALINVKGSIERERIQRREMDLRIRQEEEEEKTRQAAAQQQHSKKKSKSKKSKKSKQHQQSTALSQQPKCNNSESTSTDTSTKLNAEDFEERLVYTSLLLHRNICRGLVRYIAALRQAKMLMDPPSSITMFTTHQKRFEKRFEAFNTLPQPPSLSYEDYVRGSDFSAVQSKDLLASATDCFRSGKGVVDWLLDVIAVAPSSPETFKEEDDGIKVNESEKRRDDDLFIPIHRDEVMALAKVCVTNSLFLHKLSARQVSNGNKGGSGGEVSLDFKIHKLYCSLSIA